MKYAGTVLRVPYNYLIKELNICNIPLSVGLENDILYILLISSELKVKLKLFKIYFRYLRFTI